jgi:hypothetical protein
VQFVNFTELAERAAKQNAPAAKWEAEFALEALVELPDQYSMLVKRGMIGRCPDKPLPVTSVFDPPQ